jgi:NADPH-dependent 2,4-dienoyl-CoA reductase/sulfur reductase-like enzyme
VTTDPAIHIDPIAHKATLRSGRVFPYGTLLLATGAEAPVNPNRRRRTPARPPSTNTSRQ